MNIIVNVDLNWAIGKDGNLLNKFPEDMKFFKNKTINNTIIYGRKTLESFPNGLPLKNRKNVVITSNFNNIKNDINNAPLFTVNNPYSAIYISNIIDISKNVYVIGGASIYNEMIDFCDTIYLTKCYTKTLNADSFFPNIDKLSKWKITDSTSIKYSDNGIKYKFLKYERY